MSRLFKRFLIISLTFFFLIISGAYLFFEYKFTPVENYLSLSESSSEVEIEWVESDESTMAAMLLPVYIKGLPYRFYVQFDTGSPHTLFLKNKIASIAEKFPEAIQNLDTVSMTAGLSFDLGDMTVSSEQFILFDKHSTPINWEDTTGIKYIGTIGADLIEKKKAVIDLRNGICFFGDILPDPYQQIELSDFSFYKRKTLFPASISGQNLKLLHDTGTSGFQLITGKTVWQKMAKEDATPEEAFEVKSWNNTLKAYNIESDKKISFGANSIDLTKVTYIEGATFWQVALMRMTGMGGMIGNELFSNKVLILDCENEKYSILD